MPLCKKKNCKSMIIIFAAQIAVNQIIIKQQHNCDFFILKTPMVTQNGSD